MTRSHPEAQQAGNNIHQAILERVDKPISVATGLPNSHYTTDTSFADDRDKVIGTSWACIGFADELPSENTVQPIEFMGLPLLVTRDADDIYRVFHNVCSHRGMTLVDEPCQNNGAVKCPYHSWTYSLDGSLRATPNIGGYGQHTHPDFDASENGLKEIRSEVWLGAIFVNLDGNAPAFEDYVQPIISSWSKYINAESLKKFKLSANESTLSLTVKSNWKLPVENYLESYHLPSVHPELNRVSPLSKHYYIDSFDNGAGQGSLNYTRLEKDGTSMPSAPEWPVDMANTAEYPALYPNTFLGIHADQLFIQYLQPLDNTTTAEHVRIFYFGDEACDPEYQQHREAVQSGWKSVFEEDIFAVERMQQGRASPAYRGGAFSPVMDEPTHHFHKWVARKLA